MRGATRMVAVAVLLGALAQGCTFVHEHHWPARTAPPAHVVVYTPPRPYVYYETVHVYTPLRVVWHAPAVEIRVCQQHKQRAHGAA